MWVCVCFLGWGCGGDHFSFKAWGNQCWALEICRGREIRIWCTVRHVQYKMYIGCSVTCLCLQLQCEGFYYVLSSHVLSSCASVLVSRKPSFSAPLLKAHVQFLVLCWRLFWVSQNSVVFRLQTWWPEKKCLVQGGKKTPTNTNFSEARSGRLQQCWTGQNIERL